VTAPLAPDEQISDRFEIINVSIVARVCPGDCERQAKNKNNRGGGR
jgi:hypothetical protein